MKIFEGLTLESLFLIVFGAFVFVMGTTSLRTRMNVKKKGRVQQGTVIKSNHVTKRDAENYLIQDYYETRIEYLDNGHKTQSTVDSLQEFYPGDKVKLIKSIASKDKVTIYDNNALSVITIWTTILGGILIAIIPIVENQYGVQWVSLILATIFLLTGISFITTYIRDKNRKVTQVDAIVIDILKWHNGKKDSKLVKQTASYYPILQYNLDNQQKSMRSKYSSSNYNANKIGDKKVIYFDYENLCLLERGPRKSMLVGGMILLCISVVGMMSAVLGMI